MKKLGKLIAFPKLRKEKRNTTIQGKVYRFLGLRIVQYYSHAKDSMMVKVEQDGEVVFEEPGSQVTFSSWIEAADMFNWIQKNGYELEEEHD